MESVALRRSPRSSGVEPRRVDSSGARLEAVVLRKVETKTAKEETPRHRSHGNALQGQPPLVIRRWSKTFFPIRHFWGLNAATYRTERKYFRQLLAEIKLSCWENVWQFLGEFYWRRLFFKRSVIILSSIVIVSSVLNVELFLVNLYVSLWIIKKR